MLKIAVPGALMLGVTPVVLFAQHTDLAPVVVTANRVAQTADQTLAPVTAITRDDIERLQARSVHDLLRGTPGVNLANNGGPGKNTSLFLRGTESDHVLVLIDGLKVGAATSGTTPFQDLPVDQIERIEIVRGPRSSLYGSEAIGGVIQIFTRKGGGDTTPRFRIGAGSYQTAESSVGVSGGGERAWYNVSAGALDTDGFNACTGEPGAAGCFTDEPDRDGYQNASGAVRAGYRFDNGLQLDTRWRRTEAEVDFDGGFQNEAESVQQLLGAAAEYAPSTDWLLQVTAGRSWDRSDNFKDGVFSSRFETTRDTFSVQNDFALSPAHLVIFGLDYQRDQITSSSRFAQTERRNQGLFAQLQQQFERHTFEASLRRDDNEQFGQHTTGSAAWGYELTDQYRTVLSYGTAFKAPTFNELYFPGFGNPDLDPERSKTLEWSLRGSPRWGSWSTTVFRTEVDDLIAFDADTFAPANIGAAEIHGLEGTLSTVLAGWQLRSALTLLDTENRSPGAHRGNELPRRASRQLRLDADRRFGHYGIGATLIAQSRRYDDLANTRPLAGYATVDLRGEYRLAKDWSVQARIVNVFDRDYETAAFYNQPGRSVFVTLRYQP